MSDKRNRLLRHVITDHLSVKRAFPADALAHIERAIAAGERTHRGQVCFAVEGSLPPLRVLRGIGEISALLAQLFPRAGAVANELSDKPVVL